MIHTSKKKVIVETKGGRTATKIKTIVTTNEIKRPISTPQQQQQRPAQAAPETVSENNAKRRSNRTKQATSKILESMPSPTRNNLSNGTARSSRSPAAATATSATTNARFQNNLLSELSKKSTNYSPDVVSDLEEILGSPIKTTHEINRGGHIQSRKQAKAAPASPKKASSTVRLDYNKTSTDDEAKPATRSSKRLSGRTQPISNVESKAKPTRNSTGSSSTSARGNAKKSISSSTSVYQSAMLSEESQGSQEESYSNLHMEKNAEEENIVMNIKQEKEVSFTLTDDNTVFTCEMCSAVFSDRAQLLVHVPVHI